MGIRTDNHISGYGKTFLGKKRMLNTHLTDFEIVGDLISARKFSDAFAMLRRLDILVGNEVIGNKCDLVLVKHSVNLHFFDLMDGNR